jgi:hypothetical protein
MNKDNWVTRFEHRREQFVEAVGGSSIDLIGLLGALLPYILVITLLYNFIFNKIIEWEPMRFLASIIAAAVIEFFAIAVMTLEQRVALFNASAESGFVRYNAKAAKLNYLILVMLIALFGHIIPSILGNDYEWIALFAILPMVGISWFGYEIFTINFALKERSRTRAKAIEDDRLAKATETFAERGKTEAETNRLREQRLLEEAKARQDEAKAQQTQAQVKLVRAERRKSQPPPAPASPAKEYTEPQNGHNKPWDERSFEEIKLALAEGFEPPPIGHLDTYNRYHRLREHYYFGEQFGIGACELVGVNQVRFRKDLKLLAAHRLVKEVARGTYVLVEPERA